MMKVEAGVVATLLLSSCLIYDAAAARVEQSTRIPKRLLQISTDDDEVNDYGGACGSITTEAVDCIHTLPTRESLECLLCIDAAFEAVGDDDGEQTLVGCAGISRFVCDSFNACEMCSDACIAKLVERSNCILDEEGVLPTSCELDCDLSSTPTERPTEDQCAEEDGAAATCIHGDPSVGIDCANCYLEGIEDLNFADECVDLHGSICGLIHRCSCSACIEEFQASIDCRLGAESCGWQMCDAQPAVRTLEPTMEPRIILSEPPATSTGTPLCNDEIQAIGTCLDETTTVVAQGACVTCLIAGNLSAEISSEEMDSGCQGIVPAVCSWLDSCSCTACIAPIIDWMDCHLETDNFFGCGWDYCRVGLPSPMTSMPAIANTEKPTIAPSLAGHNDDLLLTFGDGDNGEEEDEILDDYCGAVDLELDSCMNTTMSTDDASECSACYHSRIEQVQQNRGIDGLDDINTMLCDIANAIVCSHVRCEACVSCAREIEESFACSVLKNDTTGVLENCKIDCLVYAVKNPVASSGSSRFAYLVSSAGSWLMLGLFIGKTLFGAV